MRGVPSWRVRVKRSIETFVDVDAVTAVAAEIEAAKVPGVIQVFSRSAIRSDERGLPARPAGVPDDGH